MRFAAIAEFDFRPLDAAIGTGDQQHDDSRRLVPRSVAGGDASRRAIQPARTELPARSSFETQRFASLRRMREAGGG